MQKSSPSFAPPFYNNEVSNRVEAVEKSTKVTDDKLRDHMHQQTEVNENVAEAISKMQLELDEVKKNNAEKDKVIEELQQELGTQGRVGS